MQTNSEPLSPVTRADRCAVFVKVKTMCANKGRRQSSAHRCAFASQNCKWGEPPHLVPAGSVPMPPITAPSTVGALERAGRADSWGWGQGSMFVPRLRVLMCLAGGLLTKVTIWDGSANHLFSRKHPAWIILGVPDLPVIWKGASPSAPERSTFFVNTSRNDFPRHKGKSTAASEQHVTWEALNMEV